MSKFWQKKYTSKYTGAEIDAAVGKAGNLPATTSADAGKALVVDEDGKIVTGEAGGGDIFVIHAEADSAGANPSITVVETEAAIKEAYLAGKQLVIKFTDLRTPNGTYFANLSLAVYEENTTFNLVFLASNPLHIKGGGSALEMQQVQIYLSNGTWSIVLVDEAIPLS